MKISEKEYIEQHIQNTCDLTIQHIRNVMNFQKKIGKPLGWHSRFLERLLYPEVALIFKGFSKQIFDDSATNTLKRRKEHIVPLTYLKNQIWILLEKGELSDREISRILKRNLGVAYISEDEARELDSKRYRLKRQANYRKFMLNNLLDKAVGV